ncbi:cationic amino acid transporter 4, vacuolar-like isoform X1 [Tripterygium wilfordii]|uniref:cationic amino acid transporter 4, vacuolar-like isoform X1 n=1 Tax=Tripterygium wilfordii TaxID=458696 RepID=UPI0018F8315B|nr:cationic amino acid transporter 4, vacuolar-like isoform X1 [Tripterygium wilfordii]
MQPGGGGGAKSSWGLRSLIRRKQVDSVHADREGRRQLAKRLSAFDLIAIGVGSTIGAGVYILVGTVAREHTGPALTISFLIAGIAAALSGFCYAELACRCPSAGSAYHYTYICLGEGIAWLIGWALILEYTIGGSAVARGITPNLALFFGGEDKLPFLLARHTIPGLGCVVDPCAAALVIILTLLLCIGIKESSLVQTIVTTMNVCVLLFIIIAGGCLAFKTGWVGYELPSGYIPFGVNGILSGSAVVFFSYIGFDAITSTAEEVKNPQRDLPIGVGMALFTCCFLYMLVSIVIVGLVPYYALDPDIPISSAFSTYGMHWAAYILTTGAVTALCASLFGSLLAQPRILMAMARDGMLPSFFSDISKHTRVPVTSTLTTGILAAVLAFFMDVSQLAGMVSVGTLLAFTAAAVSVLILRYVPPDEVPFPSSVQDTIDSVSQQFSINMQKSDNDFPESSQYSPDDSDAWAKYLLLGKNRGQDEYQQKRWKIAAWSIALLCIGIVVLALAGSAQGLHSFLHVALYLVGGVLLLCSLIVLACIDQDHGMHSFGHAGGFLCPFIPFLPAVCILINTYLLINLGAGTWIRVSIWLAIGALVYLFYGRTHSSLKHAIYVPSAFADEIHRASSNHLV